jgi:hypothetical protein
MNEMNVTSAQYENRTELDGTVTSNVQITAVIDGVEMSIPLDPANRHYQAILDWVAEGNTITDAS